MLNKKLYALSVMVAIKLCSKRTQWSRTGVSCVDNI